MCIENKYRKYSYITADIRFFFLSNRINFYDTNYFFIKNKNIIKKQFSLAPFKNDVSKKKH